jgi:hypothetical protein
MSWPLVLCGFVAIVIANATLKSLGLPSVADGANWVIPKLSRLASHFGKAAGWLWLLVPRFSIHIRRFLRFLQTIVSRLWSVVKRVAKSLLSSTCEIIVIPFKALREIVAGYFEGYWTYVDSAKSTLFSCLAPFYKIGPVAMLSGCVGIFGLCMYGYHTSMFDGKWSEHIVNLMKHKILSR